MADNYTILTKGYLEGTTDMQQRLPNPAQQGIAATVQALSDPMNNDLWNQFTATLNNTIGYTIIDALRWDNPFDTFRRESLQWGNSIREIMPKWLKSHTYSDTSKDLLDVNKPEYEQWYYSVNYETKYPWDMNRAELLRAMSGPSGSTQINDLYAATATAALNSDSIDMAETCIELIHTADTQWETPLYRYTVEQGTDLQENARAILQAVKTFTYRLPWPSKLYNNVDVPVFAQPNELVIFVTPETRALIDVRAYAELFNVSYAEMQGRIMTIPEIPISGALAVITTTDFIHWHDTVYGIFSFFNIDTLNDKQILHHQAIVAPNPGVPVIVLTTDEATTVPTYTMTASTLSLTPDASTVPAGGTVALNPVLSGTVTENDDGIEVKPNSITYELESTAALNTRTFVDDYSVLHVQKSIDDGATITVNATSTYYNPDATEQTPITASTTITIGDSE